MRTQWRRSGLPCYAEWCSKHFQPVFMAKFNFHSNWSGVFPLILCLTGHSSLKQRQCFMCEKHDMNTFNTFSIAALPTSFSYPGWRRQKYPHVIYICVMTGVPSGLLHWGPLVFSVFSQRLRPQTHKDVSPTPFLTPWLTHSVPRGPHRSTSLWGCDQTTVNVTHHYQTSTNFRGGSYNH